MRRSEREIRGEEELLALLRRCAVCRIAVPNGDGEAPYLVPLNYGFHYADGRLTLFFHGAKEGTKAALFQSSPPAAFELDSARGPICADADNPCACSMEYESICGQGRIAPLDAPQQKRIALSAIMRQALPERSFVFSDAQLERVACWALTAERFSGKRRRA